MANTNIMSNWLETGVTNSNKAKLHEYLKLWKTPPPSPLPRSSTLKTSWQLPSSPRPRDIKSGAWRRRRRRGNYGKWKWAARSTSSSLAEQRQVGHFYPAPLSTWSGPTTFLSGLFFGASCLHISIFNYLCVDYLWFVGVVCWTLTGQLQSSNSIKEFSHEQPPPPNATKSTWTDLKRVRTLQRRRRRLFCLH